MTPAAAVTCVTAVNMALTGQNVSMTVDHVMVISVTEELDPAHLNAHLVSTLTALKLSVNHALKVVPVAHHPLLAKPV